MAKGTRYTLEFKAKAVRLLTESRSSYSSETKQSAEDAMAELKSLRAEVAQLRRANETLTTASAFFAARPDPTRR
ncbi:transposase [Bifidobacterium catenulatum PV20-2]|uniref:Transposase n=1 Tax=Bifidobacterium catenulatum PV20-2 TaxID=1447716 RepID=A0A0A7I4N6_9BIFI|nr:transposase [Bifidobacterium catenulatum PV20-2]